MKLEDQVCSLDLAKKLKKLGVIQESHFRWRPAVEINGIVDQWTLDESAFEPNYSAFTLGELGEMLPDGSYSIRGANPMHVWNKRHQDFLARLSPNDPREKAVKKRLKHPTLWFADSEADARATMLVYLIENKLIPAPVGAGTTNTTT